LLLKIVRAVRARLRHALQVPRAVEYDPFPWLKREFRLRTLVDIGANTGEYGGFLARHFEVRRAYFFEPLPSCHAALEEVARHSGGEIFACALSDQDGSSTFFETQYGPSSSLLTPDAGAVAEFPQNAVCASSEVVLRRLDDVLRDRPIDDDLLIKIDVQGVEDRVIRGGRDAFRRARVVLVEMCFVPFYEGQPLFEEVHALLTEAGLRLAGIHNQIMMPKSGRPAFGHFIYTRS
jgi:FkbM family methyltransferase